VSVYSGPGNHLAQPDSHHFPPTLSTQWMCTSWTDASGLFSVRVGCSQCEWAVLSASGLFSVRVGCSQCECAS